MSSGKRVETNEEVQRQERRRKTDWVTKAASILSIIAWLLAVVMLLCLDRAQPEKAGFFTSLFGITVNSRWNTSLLRTSFLFLVLALGVCALAMIFNIMRSRRKTDKYKKSIIILGGITIIGIVVFIIAFGEHLL